MTYKLVYNIEPASPSMISSLDRHCLARIPDGASNIVPARSHLNRILEGHKEGLTASLKALYESGVKKPTAQAERPYLRIVLSASPGYFRPDDPEAVGTWDEDRLAAWIEASMGQLREEHGADLIFAELHLDEDTPHIHAVVAPTYLKKARVPGKQKRGETPEQFEERKELARASQGIRTVGRASHPTLSRPDSFQRLRERMTVALDHLGIEYGADRAVNAPDGQSTREWVIQQAAELREKHAAQERERHAIAQDRETLERDRKELAQAQEDHKAEAQEWIAIQARAGKSASLARDRIAKASREQEARSRERVAQLEAQARAAERRLEELSEALSASQEAEARVEALTAREEALRASVGRAEARMDSIKAEERDALAQIGAAQTRIEALEANETRLRNAVQLTGDGVENFTAAMDEVAGVTQAAADMALTNELLSAAQTRAFNDERGQPRRFANDAAQDNLVVRVITLGFQKAVDLFERLRAFTRFNDEVERARSYPEPLQQMQNVLDATDEAIRETLTQLGVADQRPDVGEHDENGDPPPVLELVFSRRNRKAKRLNNELANRLAPSGPGR